MTDIDGTTGLPVLPEGMYWRVEENALLIMESRGPGEWSGWARGDGGWRGVAGYESEIRQREDGGFGRRRVITEHRYRTEAGPRALFMKKFGQWEPFGKDSKSFVENSPVTTGNLLDRAVETLADWNDFKARQSILGDYPPKRFEAER